MTCSRPNLFFVLTPSASFRESMVTCVVAGVPEIILVDVHGVRETEVLVCFHAAGDDLPGVISKYGTGSSRLKQLSPQPQAAVPPGLTTLTP